MENNSSTELKVCRYCNQFMMCEDGQSAEDVCMCSGAMNERKRQRAAAELLDMVDRCCGEDCGEEYPDFEPTSPDILSLAKELAEQISNTNVIKATLDLGDDTRLVMSYDKVVRRRVAKAEVKPRG